MANLTETAYYTRKAIRYGAFGLIGLILLKGVLSTAIAYWRKLHPPPPPPPTVAFGKLPPIQFPQPEEEPKKVVYRLETTAGGTPNLGDRAKVYFIPVHRPTLLASQRAKLQARKMGFWGEPQKISETDYQWSKEGILPATLQMNIFTGNFTLKKSWREAQALLTQKKFPSQEQLILEAKNYLRKNGLLNPTLEKGETKVSFWRFVSPDLVKAISLSEADFVRVDFFRKELDGLPVLPPDSQESLVSFLFSGATSSDRRIVEVKFIHFPIAQETFSTYPLKTTAQAWQELKTGGGFIANLGKTEREIIIRKIYLAYFESEEAQNYLQPIYVFQGDRGFIGYVPAVSPEWVE